MCELLKYSPPVSFYHLPKCLGFFLEMTVLVILICKKNTYQANSCIDITQCQEIANCCSMNRTSREVNFLQNSESDDFQKTFGKKMCFSAKQRFAEILSFAKGSSFLELEKISVEHGSDVHRWLASNNFERKESLS